MARYEKAHPTDTDAVRRHLQLLHWLNRRPEAGELYQRAGSRPPPACAQNPYLFLNSDQAGLIVSKGFYAERYTPFEVKRQVSYSLAKHLGLEAGYVHTKSFL